MKPQCNTLTALIFTAAFGSGKVFSTAGQFVFIFEEGFSYFNITNNKIIAPSLIIAAFTTAYVRGFTRFPALWNFFSSPNKQGGIKLWYGNTLAEKANFIFMGGLSIIAALADGLQAYLGSNTMLEAVGVSEFLTKEFGDFGEATVIGFNFFLAASCSLSYLAFFSKKSVQNSILLQRELSESKIMKKNRNTVIQNVSKTLLTGSLAGIAYLAFTYYSVSEALELIWPSIPQELSTGLCSIAGGAALATFLLSRLGETYKYFTSKETSLAKTYCNQLETKKDKLIVAPHWIVGFFDIMVLMIAGYISFLGMFSFFSISNNFWVETLPIFACISVGFMHYVFSLRPVIKKCIENRESYQVPDHLEVASKKNCLSSYLSWANIFPKRENVNEIDFFQRETMSININKDDIRACEFS